MRNPSPLILLGGLLGLHFQLRNNDISMDNTSIHIKHTSLSLSDGLFEGLVGGRHWGGVCLCEGCRYHLSRLDLRYKGLTQLQKALSGELMSFGA